MKRAMQWLMPVGWTMFFLVPTTYIVWWLIESRFEVPIEPDQIRAAVVNLIRNAKDACEQGDEVLVMTRRAGDRFCPQCGTAFEATA